MKRSITIIIEDNAEPFSKKGKSSAFATVPNSLNKVFSCPDLVRIIWCDFVCHTPGEMAQTWAICKSVYEALRKYPPLRSAFFAGCSLLDYGVLHINIACQCCGWLVCKCESLISASTATKQFKLKKDDLTDLERFKVGRFHRLDRAAVTRKALVKHGNSGGLATLFRRCEFRRRNALLSRLQHTGLSEKTVSQQYPEVHQQYSNHQIGARKLVSDVVAKKLIEEFHLPFDDAVELGNQVKEFREFKLGKLSMTKLRLAVQKFVDDTQEQIRKRQILQQELNRFQHELERTALFPRMDQVDMSRLDLEQPQQQPTQELIQWLPDHVELVWNQEYHAPELFDPDNLFS